MQLGCDCMGESQWLISAFQQWENVFLSPNTLLLNATWSSFLSQTKLSLVSPNSLNIHIIIDSKCANMVLNLKLHISLSYCSNCFQFPNVIYKLSLIKNYQFRHDKGPLFLFSMKFIVIPLLFSNSLKIGTKTLAISMQGMNIKLSIYSLENGSIIW